MYLYVPTDPTRRGEIGVKLYFENYFLAGLAQVYRQALFE